MTIELIPKGKVVEEKINVQDQGTFKPELRSTSTSKGEAVDEKLEVEMKINHENDCYIRCFNYQKKLEQKVSILFLIDIHNSI